MAHLTSEKGHRDQSFITVLFFYVLQREIVTVQPDPGDMED